MSDTPIWKTPISLDRLNEMGAEIIDGHLGIEYTEFGPDFLKATMPVDHRTFQPSRRVHGGANVVLAESLGSVAANHTIDLENYACVGQEVNANHVRGAFTGTVTGVAKPAYIGRTSQVWEIRIYDERDRLTCISRLTVAVIRRSKASLLTDPKSEVSS